MSHQLEFLVTNLQDHVSSISWNRSRFEVTGFKKVHYGHEEENSKRQGHQDIVRS